MFSIKDFYLRRIRRIMPAYFCLILIVTLMSGVVLYGETLHQAALAAMASLGFSANIYFFCNTDYFAPAAELNPYLNLWSLGVEEQFYLFFPLLLMLFCRKLKRGFGIAFIAIAILSLIWSIYLLHSGQATSSFYMLPSRAWELLVGSLLAIYPRFLSKPILGLGLVGIVLAILPCYLLSSESLFPGYNAIVPVVAGVILLRQGSFGIASKLLTLRPMVFMGKISYSLYLWHWPVLIIYQYIAQTHFMKKRMYSEDSIAVFAISMLLAVLSWYYVETPFRKSKYQAKTYFLLTGLGLMVLLSLNYFVACKSSGKQGLMAQYVSSYWTGPQVDERQYPDPQWATVDKHDRYSLVQLVKLGRKNQYLLWGDSHAMAIAPGFDAFSRRNNINGIYIARRHITACDAYNKGGQADNPQYVNDVIAWLKQHSEIHTVVLSSRLGMVRFKLREHNGSPHDNMRRGFMDLFRKLHEMGKEVIVLAPVPEVDGDPSMRLLHDLNRSAQVGHYLESYEDYIASRKFILDLLAEAQELGYITLIRNEDCFYPDAKPLNIFCDNKLMYFDSDHLSPSGARLYVEYLEKALLNIIKKKVEP